MDPRLRARRMILFVPGDRPDRFSKAFATAADAVCLDLEDAVAPAAKDDARARVQAFLRQRGQQQPDGTGSETTVRISALESEAGRLDLEALATAGAWPDALLIPKTDDPAALRALAAHLEASAGPTAPALIPLIETARGLHRVEAVATATPRVAALALGGFDLCAELGAEPGWDTLLYARSRLVHAAALAGVGALDTPFLAIDDPEGLEAESRRARALGFVGKLAIHPVQVPVLARAFAPTPEQEAWARRVVEAADGAPEGVFALEGRMIDAPLVRAARQVLARAIAHPSTP
ncbi:MAG: CoA ester lyase [Gemmatimonadota bacterium]|nr:CoA ester lyase [Gemmatimonadota bacterium]